MRHASIRRTLLVALLSVVAGVWIVTAAVSYADARHEVSELLDAHMTQVASLLLAEATGEASGVDVEHAPQLHRYSRTVAFQIWENGTALRLHSLNAPDTRLSSTTSGFSDRDIGGRRWRVFSAWDATRRFLVQVAERDAERNELAAAVVRNLVVPLLAALPLLSLLIWGAVSAALRPLETVSAQVATRDPENLAPLVGQDAPAEVAPLIGSLNRLFDRMRAMLAAERRFTADASHELRTPLAAVSAQAQVARSAADENERRHALDAIIRGCERATHTVNQLLTLARLEGRQIDITKSPCDVNAVLQGAVSDVIPSALARGTEVELNAASPLGTSGDFSLLGVLFRNLIDNAVRYSPPHSNVRIEAHEDSGRVIVTIIDEGPGVAAEQLDKLGQRFHRVLGTGEPGSGLGISIARRVAALHDGTIVFETRQGSRGLQAIVSLPARADSER